MEVVMNKDIVDEKFYSVTAVKYQREINRINEKLKQLYSNVDGDRLRRVQIDQSIREEVVSLYFYGGFQTNEFINLFHVHNTTVRKWINKYGYKCKKNNDQPKEQLKVKENTETKFENNKAKVQETKHDSAVMVDNILTTNEKAGFITIDVVEESLSNDTEEPEEEFSELDYIDMSENRILLRNRSRSVENKELYEQRDECIDIKYPNNINIKIPKSMLCKDLL